MQEKIKQILIENNSNPLIFDTFTNLLLSLKQQDFKEFKNQIENYFWEIQNDSPFVIDPENYNDDYKEEFLKVGSLFDIKSFWGVQNLADLTIDQIANYMLSAIEEDKMNKINEILFNLINQ